jgi:hypothetical protein
LYRRTKWRSTDVHLLRDRTVIGNAQASGNATGGDVEAGAEMVDDLLSSAAVAVQ